MPVSSGEHRKWSLEKKWIFSSTNNVCFQWYSPLQINNKPFFFLFLGWVTVCPGYVSHFLSFHYPSSSALLSPSSIFQSTSFHHVTPLSLSVHHTPCLSLFFFFPPPFSFIFSHVASRILQSLFPTLSPFHPSSLPPFAFYPSFFISGYFSLTVHRSVFLPPLGGNGKSDISYLVNGERWRERERDMRGNRR